jgi:hypothetical protein
MVPRRAGESATSPEQRIRCLRRFFHRRRGQGGPAAWPDPNEIADSAAEPDEEERAQLGDVHRRALELVRGELEPRSWQSFCLTTAAPTR